jgi:hypothetical protein
MLRTYPAVDRQPVDEPPDVEYIPSLCCPDCRAGKLDLGVPVNQYYYCAPCEIEWCIPGPARPGAHPDAGDIARIITFPIAGLAIFLGAAYLTTRRLIPDFEPSTQGHEAAAVLGTLLALLPTIPALAIVIFTVNGIIAPAALATWRGIWGAPL